MMNKSVFGSCFVLAPPFQKVGNMLYQNNLNWTCVILYNE